MVSTGWWKSDSNSIPKDHPLTPYADQLLQVYTISQDSPEIRSVIVLGFASLIQSGLLMEQKINQTMEIMAQLLLEDSSANVRNECVKSFMKLCETHSRLILQFPIPKLIQQLLSQGTLPQGNSRKDAADSLAAFSLFPHIYLEISNQILPTFEKYLGALRDSSSQILNDIIINCLRLFSKILKSSSQEPIIHSIWENFLPHFFKPLILSSFKHSSTLIDKQIIQDYIEILNLLTSKLSSE